MVLYGFKSVMFFRQSKKEIFSSTINFDILLGKIKMESLRLKSCFWMRNILYYKNKQLVVKLWKVLQKRLSIIIFFIIMVSYVIYSTIYYGIIFISKFIMNTWNQRSDHWNLAIREKLQKLKLNKALGNHAIIYLRIYGCERVVIYTLFIIYEIIINVLILGQCPFHKTRIMKNYIYI